MPVATAGVEDSLFRQSEIHFLFFSAERAPEDLISPLLRELYGSKVELADQYFPAATLLDEKEGPAGLDTTLQLSVVTWEEILLRFVPRSGPLLSPPSNSRLSFAAHVIFS